LVTNCRMLKKHSFITLFILLQLAVAGQTIPDSNYVDITSIRDSTMALNKTFLFFDSNNVASIENIGQQNFVLFTRAIFRKYYPFVPAHLVSKPVYLKVALFNSSSVADTIFLFPGIVYDEILVYKVAADNKVKYEGDGSKGGFCNLAVAPGEKKIFIIKLKFCRHEYNVLKPQLINKHYWKAYKAVFYDRLEDIRNIGFLLSGLLFMMILFTIVNYILTSKKEFLYYIGYAVSMFLLILLLALQGGAWGSFTSFFSGYLDLFLLILGNVFYLAFSRYFLDTKNNYTTLDKIFKIEEKFLLVLLLAFTLIHYFTGWFLVEQLLENLMKVIMLAMGIVFIVIAFKQKGRLIIYLAVGSAFNIFFNIISLILILVKIPATNVFSHALFYHDIGLVFALAAFLLGLTYKNRRELIERIKEQEALKMDVEKKDFENRIAIIKAQQEERNRISADMHDDLGAGMTTIRLYSELAKSRIGAGGTSIPEIEKISSSANELLNKMNAIIWSMSSSNDSLGNMVAYIRSYSLEYFEDSGINCRISLPENLPNIVVSGEIRRNVFLVIKEALNNVLKHSKATDVSITLLKEKDGLKLLIQDNGTGIDFEKLRQFGNGLKNMQKRMDDIHIHFSIENNNGTLITLFRAIPNF